MATVENITRAPDDGAALIITPDSAVAARTPPPFVSAGQDIAPLLSSLDPKLVSTIGRNIEASADRSRAIATVAGLLRTIDGTVFVEPAIERTASIEASGGDVSNETGSIVVRGDIGNQAHVRASASIFVAGIIDAAEVIAGGDVVVAGGIIQRGKGRCIANGNVLAKFISGANIDVAGDVVAQTEISASQVTCSGQLISEHGPLVGSAVVAASGVRCRILGCPAITRALVEVGADDRLRRLATLQLPEIDARRRRAHRMRIVVEPLLRHQKHLTVEARDKVTELLFEIKELQVQTDEMIAKLRALYERMRRRAAAADIRVADVIYPGVTVRFPGMQATLQTPLRGPVRIAVKELDGQRRIVALEDDVAIRTTARSMIVLDHEPFTDPTLAGLEALLK